MYLHKRNWNFIIMLLSTLFHDKILILPTVATLAQTWRNNIYCLYFMYVYWKKDYCLNPVHLRVGDAICRVRWYKLPGGIAASGVTINFVSFLFGGIPLFSNSWLYSSENCEKQRCISQHFILHIVQSHGTVYTHL